MELKVGDRIAVKIGEEMGDGDLFGREQSGIIGRGRAQAEQRCAQEMLSVFKFLPEAISGGEAEGTLKGGKGGVPSGFDGGMTGGLKEVDEKGGEERGRDDVSGDEGAEEDGEGSAATVVWTYVAAEQSFTASDLFALIAREAVQKAMTDDKVIGQTMRTCG